MSRELFNLLDFKDDDRVFILQIVSSESRGQYDQESTKKISVVTRRNKPGYPAWRIDDFDTYEEAKEFYLDIVVTTPRKSLDEKSPDPKPSLDEYTAWLIENKLEDQILNQNVKTK